jgi:hypothetical protein
MIIQTFADAKCYAPRPAVFAFAMVMEEVLQQNDFKGKDGWKGADI